jgi:AraC-like DNA-binding protein
MIIRDFLPEPALREFVQCYRIVDFEFGKLDNIPFKAYAPKPEQCLHFFLRDPIDIEIEDEKKITLPAILFTGQPTSLVKRFFGSNLLNVQIVFQPMAVYRLTGIPAYEFTNQLLDATGIFQHRIQYCFEQLQAAKDYSELILIINRFAKELICHCRKDVLPLDFISRQMMQSGGNIPVDRMARESCLCPRQFRRKFYERTGVNPKTYLRIIHFNKAFNFKNRFPKNEWSRIAIACGYTDYQHLAKDYREFTGLTPPELHLLENKAPESVLGLTKSLYHTRYRAMY